MTGARIGNAARIGRAQARALLSASLVLGCTTILDIDDEYVQIADEPAPTGGAGGASATSSGTGGAAASVTGGGGVGGTFLDAASQDAAPDPVTCADSDGCPPDQKCCDGRCVLLSPQTGCSPVDCAPCPVPVPNAEPICESEACSARCRAGFVPGDGRCVPEGEDAGVGVAGAGGVGAGGVGAGGGSTGTCVREACPLCLNPALGVVRCCDLLTDQCGCSWFEVAYCVE